MSTTRSFIYSVMLTIEVDAFDEDDAAEVIQDCFGEGDFCGLAVKDVEVLDYEELD